MNRKIAPQLLAALLGTAAVVSPVLAQEAGQAGENCIALKSLTEDNKDRLQQEWREAANRVANSGNEAECRTYVEDASTALRAEGASADAVEARGRIVVTQPDPSVTVQQGQPEVTVRQPPSRVTVNQGEPQITVRQAPPTITVEIPRPIITIDQPQPEIIVRMPEPQVGVETPEPEIEVRMPPPDVAVTQPEPQVQVQMAETEGADDGADVQIEQGQAIIRRAEPEGEAQVEVQRGEPQVSFESAEPNVQFSQPQEPEIRYSQSGEPSIRIERQGGDGQQAAAEGTAESQPEPAENRGATRGLEASLLADANTAAQDPGELRAYAVTDLVGKPVVGVQGDQLGTVEQLVTTGERNFAVLTSDSAALGDQNLVIPLDVVTVENDRLALRGLSKEDFTALQSGQLARQARPIGQEYSIEIATR